MTMLLMIVVEFASFVFLFVVFFLAVVYETRITHANNKIPLVTIITSRTVLFIPNLVSMIDFVLVIVEIYIPSVVSIEPVPVVDVSVTSESVVVVSVASG